MGSVGFDRREALDRFAGVEPDCLSKGKKLNHVDLSLPTFNGRDKGLISAELLRNISPGQKLPVFTQMIA